MLSDGENKPLSPPAEPVPKRFDFGAPQPGQSSSQPADAPLQRPDAMGADVSRVPPTLEMLVADFVSKLKDRFPARLKHRPKALMRLTSTSIIADLADAQRLTLLIQYIQQLRHSVAHKS